MMSASIYLAKHAAPHLLIPAQLLCVLACVSCGPKTENLIAEHQRVQETKLGELSERIVEISGRLDQRAEELETHSQRIAALDASLGEIKTQIEDLRKSGPVGYQIVREWGREPVQEGSVQDEKTSPSLKGMEIVLVEEVPKTAALELACSLRRKFESYENINITIHASPTPGSGETAGETLVVISKQASAGRDDITWLGGGRTEVLTLDGD
jgi:hypothetical protein